MAIPEYDELDALGLGALVRGGELSAADLVDEAIARTERHNGTLNAVVTDMFEHARRAAAGDVGTGPFAGVPFLMKDFGAEVAGVRFTEGTAFLSDYVPEVDSEYYARCTRAGLITIGKTNLPELAIGATTEGRFLGPARNPWDPERTPGGSSGGAGAAVAARIVPLAHGNDVAGSIRIPASCCGLVGLKPTRGRVTLAPHYGDVMAGFFCELGLTRSVRDTAALLDALAGPVAGEPYLAPAPSRPWLEEVGVDPGRLRIGFSTVTPLGDPLDPECVTAIRETAALLESLGHDVEEAAPQFDAMDLWTKFTTLLASVVAWMVADWARRTGQEPSAERFEPFVWAFRERGLALTGADYLLALQDVQREARALMAFFDERDIWLTTTLGRPPVPLGTLVYSGDPIELRRRSAGFSPYTYLANATGAPAMSLPLHWSESGLPVGLHFSARQGAEDVLIRLASQLEQARPWADRRPPIAG